MKDITIVRRKYYAQTTIGELFINGDFFCYTLEDALRPPSIKVKKFTAIPADDYFVTTRFSPSFGRDMLMLYNGEDDTEINNGTIKFNYVYFHGGNKHQDTDGCILVAYNENGNTIYNSAEKDLFDNINESLEKGEQVIVFIDNHPQYN